MSTPAQTVQDQIQAALAAMMQQQQPAAGGWATPTGAGPQQYLGVSVPLKIQLPDGSSLRVYVQLPGELMQSPQTLMAAIQGLVQAGLPLDAWAPQGGGSWGNGGSRSSWSGRTRGRW